MPKLFIAYIYTSLLNANPLSWNGLIVHLLSLLRSKGKSYSFLELFFFKLKLSMCLYINRAFEKIAFIIPSYAF